jgi:hypothetical protein
LLELSRTSAYFAGVRKPYRPFSKAVEALAAAQEWFDKRICSDWNFVFLSLNPSFDRDYSRTTLSRTTQTRCPTIVSKFL